MDSEEKQYIMTRIYESLLKSEPGYKNFEFGANEGLSYQLTVKVDERLYIFKADNIDELIVKEDRDIEEVVAENSKSLEKIIEIDSVRKKSKNNKVV